MKFVPLLFGELSGRGVTIQQSNQKQRVNHVWWCRPVIPALGRLRQEDSKFEASLGYLDRCCLKKK
jgi:hypothetical protein